MGCRPIPRASAAVTTSVSLRWSGNWATACNPAARPVTCTAGACLLTPGQIAQRVGVATPTDVNTTTRMENAGFVVRRPDSNDARLVRVHLTDHGLAVRGDIEAERDELARRATAALTKDERRHVHSALRKIIKELAADPKL